MKPTCTYQEVVERTLATASQSWDKIVPATDIQLSNGMVVLHSTNGDRRELSATTWAEGQLCAKLGIPAQYFRRCPPELQDAQFAYWMDRLCESKPKPMLLRGCGETVRGILSSRYARIDNIQLVEAARPLAEQGLVPVWFEESDASFHLRLVDPSPIGEAKPGDPLFRGVHIANSEVGKRTLSVDAIVYRQVCANGLVRLVKNRSVLARRHVGTILNLGPTVLAAAEQALSLGAETAQALAATRTKPVADPEGEVERLGAAWDLSEDVQESIVRQLSYEPEPETAFGLINAITAAAQRQEPDNRFRLESLAGSLL